MAMLKQHEHFLFGSEQAKFQNSQKLTKCNLPICRFYHLKINAVNLRAAKKRHS